MLWLPAITLIKSEVRFKLAFLLYHCLPAMLLDFTLRMKGSKMRLLPIYQKVYYFTNLYTYFAHNTWTFEDDNMRKIYTLMSEEDLKTFHCIIKSEDYVEYTRNACEGFRRYFFKETEQDLIEGRKKLRNFKLIYYSFMSALTLGLVLKMNVILGSISSVVL